MTANVYDVLVAVVCFFAVTKPASICNHKKFQKQREWFTSNNTLVTYCSVDFTSLREYIFPADKIPWRIQLAKFFGGFFCKFVNWRQLMGSNYDLMLSI